MCLNAAPPDDNSAAVVRASTADRMLLGRMGVSMQRAGRWEGRDGEYIRYRHQGAGEMEVPHSGLSC